MNDIKRQRLSNWSAVPMAVSKEFEPHHNLIHLVRVAALEGQVGLGEGHPGRQHGCQGHH